MSQGHEESLIEFKSGWELNQQLIHAVQELDEHWRGLLVSAFATTTELKLMPEGAPFLVDQVEKAFCRAVVRVEHALRQRRQLSRAVPSVTSIHSMLTY